MDKPWNKDEQAFYRELLIKLLCTDTRRFDGTTSPESIARDAASLADQGLIECRKRMEANALP